MTADRVRTLALFDSLGFVVEARLRDHVRDGSGTPHDLVVLAHHAAG